MSVVSGRSLGVRIALDLDGMCCDYVVEVQGR